ncbi:MAG: nucleotidyltransferase family protein [Candidatus Onthomonas sp.]
MEQSVLLLAALRAHLAGIPLEAETGPVTQEEWLRLFHHAQEHHILPMVYEAVRTLPAFQESGQALIPALRREIFQTVAAQTQRTQQFLSVCQGLRAADVKAVVVKGLHCRTLYPMPDHRVSSDEDLLVAPEQYEACHQALAGLGLIPENPEEDRAAAFEVTYVNASRTLCLEVHKSLFSEDSRAYGSLNRCFDGAMGRAVELEVQGQPVWSLCPHDHLLYLICHAFKHFLHGGFGIRQVCDICLYAQRYGDAIDWSLLYDQCREERMELFAAALFAIGEQQLGISLALPPLWRALCGRVDPAPLLQDLLSSGIYGGTDMNRKHSSNITLSAVSDQKAGKKGEGSLLRTVFLPLDAMAGKYPYLNRWPVLLPVAWGQRIFHYLRENRGQSVGGAAVESVRLGRERVELLRQYGILDGKDKRP